MRESFFCHVCRRGEQNGGAACCFFDMKTARLFLPLIIFVCHAVSGCCLIYDYDNCPPESEDDFDVDSDWKYAPAAQPEGMAYVFFPADGGEAWPPQPVADTSSGTFRRRPLSALRLYAPKPCLQASGRNRSIHRTKACRDISPHFLRQAPHRGR